MGSEGITRAIEAAQLGQGFFIYDDIVGQGTLLSYPAATVEREQVERLVSFGCGIVAVVIDEPTATRCDLPLMVSTRQNPNGPAFTVSVNARWGKRYGVTIGERLKTIHALANPLTSHFDLVRPGHVFPILSHPEGLLGRSGLAEASADLMGLAGCPPIVAAALLTDSDENLMSLKDVKLLSEETSYPLTTVSDLIDTRLTQLMSK
ncbi:3,4-dihydroxy-2-butanone 4-phosphate synthase (plasmid) [Vibrio coralliilyticus]|jgi:3,4-dihydroxy-2-butanone 4-phosphate synthase|nr:3,4-dihydroxy-2-butanone-4-phosphate synthase [Vibrio sp.]ARC94939.1 3,4-dihydroxy-2-butanone 4-phosphate synthase [Vibrio coralliilyticus]QXL80275.1 3,2C4-dihydroxy-2-butanone 4-phosphate synthase [Vibrio sp.]